MLLIGDISVTASSTWLWDGSRWTLVFAGPSPSGRVSPAAATLDGRVVMFGGYGSNARGNGFLDDTWVWDGTAWTQQHPEQSPPARYHAAMATLNGRVVLYGGESSGGVLGDTWEWDGTSWTEMHPAVSPAPRWNAAAASLEGKMVLFGGTLGNAVGAITVNETWEWDGADWTQLRPNTSPSAREAAMAQTLDGRVILFGGRLGTSPQSNTQWTYFDETWAWDGATWAKLAPSPSPAPRAWGLGGTLGATVILFGGVNNNSTDLSDTWIWNGSTWADARASGPGFAGAQGAMSCY
jgi:hypothetical protein